MDPHARPGAIDLALVTPEEVAGLKRTHLLLGCTVEQARLTWRAELGAARAAVLPCEGNGGAPVLVLVPPGLAAAAPVTVHTHFHGDLTAAGAPGGVHTLRIREALAAEPQRVWVLPEAQANVGRGATDWDNVQDHRRLVTEALAAVGLGVRPKDRLVVSAHSSGGRALARLLGGPGLAAHQLVLLDCLTGRAAPLVDAVERCGLGQVEDLVVVSSRRASAALEARLLAAAGGRGRREALVPRAGLSDHAAAARNHLVPRSP